MNTADLFLYYAIFTIIFAFFAPIILEKFGAKLVKKHGKQRKSIFTLLAFFALLFIWINGEGGISEITSFILFSIHILLFLGYFSFSIKKYCDDKKRIEQAQARRLRK